MRISGEHSSEEQDENSGLGSRSLLCFFFRAAPAAYGSSKARVQIRTTSSTCTTVHGNAGSLTHWVRPGIKPATSWLPFRFISTVPRWEFLESSLYLSISLPLNLACQEFPLPGLRAGALLFRAVFSLFDGELGGNWKEGRKANSRVWNWTPGLEEIFKGYGHVRITDR